MRTVLPIDNKFFISYKLIHAAIREVINGVNCHASCL